MFMPTIWHDGKLWYDAGEDCAVCRAVDFCDTDLEYKTCIDTFEAWLSKEAV